jgi:hypothetical protein
MNPHFDNYREASAKPLNRKVIPIAEPTLEYWRTAEIPTGWYIIARPRPCIDARLRLLDIFPFLPSSFLEFWKTLSSLIQSHIRLSTFVLQNSSNDGTHQSIWEVLWELSRTEGISSRDTIPRGYSTWRYAPPSPPIPELSTNHYDCNRWCNRNGFNHWHVSYSSLLLNILDRSWQTSSGKALATAGPAPLFIGYTLVGLLCFVVMSALGEVSKSNCVTMTFRTDELI